MVTRRSPKATSPAAEPTQATPAVLAQTAPDARDAPEAPDAPAASQPTPRPRRRASTLKRPTPAPQSATPAQPDAGDPSKREPASKKDRTTRTRKASSQRTAPPDNGKAAKGRREVKPPKVRQRPVRDSFTMPEADFSLIATLKARALTGQRAVKKSELLRAGLHALAGLDTASLLAALDALEPVKLGRPRKHH